ncbi:hypothetical protein N7519_001242 [Penicillium mononematosum]|uniref:uncharacterized protein n=1 Tax=Penicillium mononematosum TaxID=268346 RepID=UPI0025469114|nr:uncharacterized protein N7519_001242 [Penicillium mononematosum]KAJ6191221.1 hypothetical protein N7519_001242 [Penicillium mononematosum]
MMAAMTYLDTLMRSFTTFIVDSLEAAPFQTSAIFAPTVITFVFRLCGLAPMDEPQRICLRRKWGC